jgi:hypothetical protein
VFAYRSWLLVAVPIFAMLVTTLAAVLPAVGGTGGTGHHCGAMKYECANYSATELIVCAIPRVEDSKTVAVEPASCPRHCGKSHARIVIFFEAGGVAPVPPCDQRRRLHSFTK